MFLKLIGCCFPSVTWNTTTIENWRNLEEQQDANQVTKSDNKCKINFQCKRDLGSHNNWKINDTFFQKHVKTERVTTILTIGSWIFTLWTSENETFVLVEIEDDQKLHSAYGNTVKFNGLIRDIASIYTEQVVVGKRELILKGVELDIRIPFTNSSQVNQANDLYWTYGKLSQDA